WCGDVGDGQSVVRREGAGHPVWPRVDLAAAQRHVFPVGVIAHRADRFLVIDGGLDLFRDLRMLAIGANYHPGGLDDLGAAALVSTDARNAIAVHRDLVDREGFADLRPSLPGGVDQYLVQQGPARAVERIDPLEEGVATLEDDDAGVKAEGAG